MKKTVPFFIALLMSALHSLAIVGYTQLWDKGNSFYLQKQYDSALVYYEQIAATKPRNPEIYYNLGNTYYRLNKIPNSILNYERALRFDPRYKDAHENLALARGRITNNIPYSGDIFFIQWWNSLTRADKSTLWAISALIPFCLIIIAMIIRRFNSASVAFLPGQLLGILWLVCISFLVLAYFSSVHNQQYDGAVVMFNDAPLMNPTLKGKPVTLVPEGTTVKVLDVKSNWAEVRLPDGRTGWLQMNVMEKI